MDSNFWILKQIDIRKWEKCFLVAYLELKRQVSDFSPEESGHVTGT